MAKKVLKKAQDGDAVRQYQREQQAIASAKAQLSSSAIKDRLKSIPSDKLAKTSLKGTLSEYEKMYAPKKKMGGMIKRADGSTSQRGLWDNIRANKGSGKKPTSAMLKQEKKIKAKKAEDGTTVDKGMTRTGEVKKRSSPGEELKGFYKRDFLKADSAKTKTGEVLRKAGNTAIKAAFTPQALMTAGMRTGGPRKANKSDLDKIPEKKMGGKVMMKTKK